MAKKVATPTATQLTLDFQEGLVFNEPSYTVFGTRSQDIRDKVASLGDADINRLLTADGVRQIVREAGTLHDYYKETYLSLHDVGNHWNSWARNVHIGKEDRLFVGLYVQFSNTDRDDVEYGTKFFGPGDYRGTIEGVDHYGAPRNYYYTYSSKDKAEVRRAILNAYADYRAKEEQKCGIPSTIKGASKDAPEKKEVTDIIVSRCESKTARAFLPWQRDVLMSRIQVLGDSLPGGRREAAEKLIRDAGLGSLRVPKAWQEDVKQEIRDLADGKVRGLGGQGLRR